MKTKARPKKWNQNHSPVGWYLATYMERFEFEGEDKCNLRRRCRAWENTILVKASTPAQAYRRALQLAKKDHSPWTNARGEKGKLLFEGLIDLLPIYEPLEDGNEIMWADHQNVSVQKVKRRIKKKHELDVFRS